MATITLADVQAVADTLAALAPATQARIPSADKSLLAFGHRLGLLPVNPGVPLRLRWIKATLGARILGETDVQRMLALEIQPRDRVLLRLAYAAGLCVSEICGLTWADVQPRDEAGQVVVFGRAGRHAWCYSPLRRGASWWRCRGARLPRRPCSAGGRAAP